ncbi:MAG: hypothetical protein IH991_00610 [Planctomycetes bacterium]|nr:hypothetical protein [Planctomycetota bacterium]
MADESSPQRTGSPPELKLGPFPGGITVDVWLNEIETKDGKRHVRSITISPRRYRDDETGEWKNASYRPIDLGILLLALEKAQHFVYSTPLPGGQSQGDHDDDDIPF